MTKMFLPRCSLPALCANFSHRKNLKICQLFFIFCYRQAFSFVQGKRFCINPNEGFIAQLMEYEPIYKAQVMQYSDSQSQSNPRNKRNFDAIDDR